MSDSWSRQAGEEGKRWVELRPQPAPAAPFRAERSRWLFPRGPRYLSIVLMVMLAGGLIVSAAAIALLAALSKPVAIPEPREDTLARTSRIYAADGTLLATWHGQINREPVPLSKMSPALQQAVIAAEDSGFYSHQAVDFRAMLRAFWADLQSGETVQGGSTITQQYVKTAFVGKQKTLFRKLREARVAYALERSLTKNKILERYLNTIYFGRGAYGVEVAARAYFNKTAADLNISESAMLAGLIPSPSTYSPDASPAKAESRRLLVIGRLEQLGRISRSDAEDARANPPKVTPAKDPTQRATSNGWFLDAVRTYLVGKYGESRLYEGGLKVVTTLDPKMQKEAESVIAKTLPDPIDPHAALVSIDPSTGYVKAVVGGRDYEHEKFNIATQGRRQPGSAFKPFVLVAALEKGITPDASYSGPDTICLDGWKPDCHVNNFEHEAFGTISLEEATIHSVNTVYAQVILQVGPKKVVDVARRMGVPGPGTLAPDPTCRPPGSDACRRHLPEVPSLALGSAEVTPLDMASAFATLASGGLYREPKLVSSVTDSSGNVLESGPSSATRAISPEIAATVTRILSEVIQRGTGVGASIGRPASGKTGTAEDFENAWFVGYTPDLATAVWMGYRDANRAMLGIHGVAKVAGGTIPASIWADYMRQALSGVPIPNPAPADSPTPTDSPSPTPGDTTTPSPAPSPESSPVPAPSPSPTQNCLLILCT